MPEEDFDTKLIHKYSQEIMSYIQTIDLQNDGDRMYSNYQKVAAYTLRLSEMHNEIALMEIEGTASPNLKKLRTMVIDPTIERFDKIANYESRKITAKGLEIQLER